MKHIKTYQLFENEQKTYYTTSRPMSLDEFKELEIEDRGNYEEEEVNEWVKKYGITDKSQLLWVALNPWTAARYLYFSVEQWDDAEKIYKAGSDDEYPVDIVSVSDGTIIEESDDGNEGFLMLMNDNWNGL